MLVFQTEAKEDVGYWSKNGNGNSTRYTERHSTDAEPVSSDEQ